MKDYYVDKYTKMGYDVIFVFADPNLEDDVDYIYDKENNMAVLKCEDGFENLTNKTYYLTKMILSSSRLRNYDYIIKMDDDTEFNMQHNNLSDMDFFKEERNYIGPKLLVSEPMEHDYHFGKCTNDIELNITPFELKEKLSWGSGFFYILSRQAITIINGCITADPSILKDFLYEDMMVGKILSENDINYELFLSNYIITDLKRPRTNSLNKLIIQQQQTSDTSYSRMSFMPKSISRIKKVTFNFNKTEDTNNIDDELSEKIKKEVNINQELDKKIKELSQKLNGASNTRNNNITNNNINNNTNNNKQINSSSKQNTNSKQNINTNESRRIPNPIITKNAKKISGKMMIRR
jgi:hypothetical protein